MKGKPRSRAGGREPLIEAALQIVEEYGAAAVTIRNVAQRAGVSPGTVSYHFQSVDGLVVAALEQGAAGIASTLEDLALDLQTTSWDADAWARVFAAALASELEHNRARHVACFELHMLAARRPALRAVTDRVLTAYLRIARIALTSIGSNDVDGASVRLVAMLTGLMLSELVNRQPGAEDRLAVVLLGALAEHRAAATV